ncbi:MAG: hypothetical protein PVH00_14315 [Gemmatimonadota bacterium]
MSAVLLVLAVVTVVATGLLAIATRRFLDARDAARMVRVRSAAESAIRRALVYWDADSMRAMPFGAVRPLPAAAVAQPGGAIGRAEAERLDERRYLLRAGARHTAGIRGTAVAAATALVTTVPLDTIWRDFYAALAVAGDVDLADGTVISGIDAGVPTPWSPTDCPAGLAVLVAALLGGADRPGIALPAAGASLVATGATVAGLPPVWNGAPRTHTADFHRLGPIPLSDIATIADRTEAGSVRLAPSAAGTICDRTAPGNWGAPGDPADPCFDFVPLIFATSDLEITGGAGQGILVVDGSVTFRVGAGFTGLVLATGRVELDGARITGAVRAAAGARIDGVIETSGCAVGRVLRRTRALRRPYRSGVRLWLPSF